MLSLESEDLLTADAMFEDDLPAPSVTQSGTNHLDSLEAKALADGARELFGTSRHDKDSIAGVEVCANPCEAFAMQHALGVDEAVGKGVNGRLPVLLAVACGDQPEEDRERSRPRRVNEQPRRGGRGRQKHGECPKRTPPGKATAERRERVYRDERAVEIEDDDGPLRRRLGRILWRLRGRHVAGVLHDSRDLHARRPTTLGTRRGCSVPGLFAELPSGGRAFGSEALREPR